MGFMYLFYCSAVNSQTSLFLLYGSSLEARGTLIVEHMSSPNGGFVALFDRSTVNLAEVRSIPEGSWQYAYRGLF